MEYIFNKRLYQKEKRALEIKNKKGKEMKIHFIDVLLLENATNFII